MENLSEKLAEILNNPESMQRVKNMAESLLSEKENPPEEKPTDLLSNIGGEELGMIMNIMKAFKGQNDDSRARLLLALKPHLSEPRREKVDTAIKILKLIDILPLLRESGILKLL